MATKIGRFSALFTPPSQQTKKAPAAAAASSWLYTGHKKTWFTANLSLLIFILPFVTCKTYSWNTKITAHKNVSMASKLPAFEVCVWQTLLFHSAVRSLENFYHNNDFKSVFPNICVFKSEIGSSVLKLPLDWHLLAHASDNFPSSSFLLY